MASCGVCMTARRLVAVAVDDDGDILAAPHTAQRDDDGRYALVALVEAEYGRDTVLVVTQTLLAADALPRIAMQRGASVRVAPDELLTFACRIADPPRSAPRKLAALLARMPLSRPFAERLQRLELQLQLFGSCPQGAITDITASQALAARTPPAQ